MRKFFAKFLDIKVLSVVFAILLWYYVIGVQGPIITRTFKVPITPINLESGVFIVNNPGFVNVTAEGSSKVILGVKPNDFTALVNLAGKEEGEFYIPVEVKPPTSSIKVKNVSPEKVKISLEKITSMSLPIIVKFTGTPGKNFMPAEPIITPNKVRIIGPSSKLKLVKSAIVNVDLTGINSDTTLVLPIQLETEQNANITDVQVNPSSCVVKILAKNPLVSKTVPVVPLISGTPFQGFGVKSVTVQPATVTIEGKLSQINNINFVNTSQIDITGLTSEKKFSPTFAVPDGVKIVGKNSCSVDIFIEPLKTVTFDIPVSVNYDSVKYDVKVNTKTVKVILKGFAEDLENISSQAITAEVDVMSFSPGDYTVPVIVKGLPKNTIIATVEPEVIKISIVAKGGG